MCVDSLHSKFKNRQATPFQMTLNKTATSGGLEDGLGYNSFQSEKVFISPFWWIHK
jgi:hypothetical protein